ncbi:ABC transporter substrate-binding protein [Bradyrhizobium sp. 186]|uniref:ABC transporter substrate-binding protein n=1 Tax=Bradyrhizobium sp. 186 TaxID=2782654 RepID=UPI002000E65D|nr:ABC transporter substrate-binding protein [Bradyrhizobium sp. 186]UPK32672.1 ABC transporter substrate-binding protein [Bradyrhizobium sp. 186]
MGRQFSRRRVLAGAAATLVLGEAGTARAAAPGPGVSADEIKLGATAYYSGPASTAAAYGQAQVAYFHMLNDQGGINGRKVNLISLDNAFSPSKAIEQTRRLVESDEVFAIAGSLGTPTNVAIQKYLNGKGVPNLFLTSGAERFNDPREFPWIIPFYPIYVAQGALFAKYILRERPDARIAVQYENDDLGRDYIRGLKQGLGDKAATMIVKELSHELSDPTIDSQILELKASGADVLLQFTQSKFAAQAIRMAAGLNWHPLHVVCSNAGSIGTTFIPAGAEASKGVITATWERNPADPAQADHPAVKQFKIFAAKYMPSLDLNNTAALPGYNNALYDRAGASALRRRTDARKPVAAGDHAEGCRATHVYRRDRRLQFADRLSRDPSSPARAFRRNDAGTARGAGLAA